MMSEKKNNYNLSALVASLFLISSQAEADLPPVRIDRNSISVSGISSGAAMAQQLVIAYPEYFKSLGIYAGPVWNCANGNADQAQETCMKNPENISLPTIFQKLTDLQKNGSVGKQQLLRNTKVYIWHGQNDSRVNPLQAKLVTEFWENLIPVNQIRRNTFMKAEHVFPTLSKGGSCQIATTPFIGKCGFDAVQEMFEFFYGMLEERTPDNQSLKIESLEQTPHLEPNSLMGKNAFYHVPFSCQDGKNQCRLHIALHGCKQSPELIDAKFVKETGYLEWAENSKTVLLFPTSSLSQNNPYGCWDWWGYTSENYLTRESPQIKSIKKLVDLILLRSTDVPK